MIIIPLALAAGKVAAFSRHQPNAAIQPNFRARPLLRLLRQGESVSSLFDDITAERAAYCRPRHAMYDFSMGAAHADATRRLICFRCRCLPPLCYFRHADYRAAARLFCGELLSAYDAMSDDADGRAASAAPSASILPCAPRRADIGQPPTQLATPP